MRRLRSTGRTVLVSCEWEYLRDFKCSFATTENGGKILTARNCHKAVYHAICLNRLEAEYLYPEEITEFGINGGIRAEDVRKALEKDAMHCAGNRGW